MARKRSISVPFESIVVDPGFNTRTTYDPDYIMQLKASIQSSGLLHNLGVTPAKGNTVEDTPRYHLIYGFCRYYAIQKIRDELGPDAYATLDVRVHEGTIADLREKNFKENLERKQLKPFEIAEEVVRMANSGLEQRDIATRMGRPQSWVSIHYKVKTKLVPTAWNAFRDGAVTLEQALHIADLPEEAQDDIVEQVLNAETRTEARQITKEATKEKGTRRVYSNKGRPTAKNLAKFVSDASFEATSKPATVVDRSFFNGIAAGIRIALGDLEFEKVTPTNEYHDTDYHAKFGPKKKTKASDSEDEPKEAKTNGATKKKTSRKSSPKPKGTTKRKAKTAAAATT